MLSVEEKRELVSDALSSCCINDLVLETSKKCCDTMLSSLSSALEMSESSLDGIGISAINSATDYINKLEKNNKALKELVLEFGSGVSFSNAEEMKKLINELQRF